MKEHATTELIENVLNKVIFRNNDDVFINSQLPPWDESRKACDIVIKYAIEGSYDLNILCFVECKRTKKTTPYSLGLVEKQALQYCAEYLHQISGVPFVYACTACGAHLRLWKYSPGTGSLQGFWNGNTPADWASYKDIGVDADARIIQQAFDHMLSMPPNLAAGQDYESYGSEHSGKGKGKESSVSYSPAKFIQRTQDQQGRKVWVLEKDGTPGAYLEEGFEWNTEKGVYVNKRYRLYTMVPEVRTAGQGPAGRT